MMISHAHRLAAALAASLVLLVSMPLAGAQDSDLAPAAPPLWRIADGAGEVWLFATYFAPPPDAPWRSEDLARAIDAAEEVWIEADAQAEGAQAAVTRVMQTKGFLPPNLRLSQVLEDDAIGFAAIATELGLDLDALQTMRPWQAHLILTVRFIATNGAKPGEGVERAIVEESKARGRPIRYLKTIEEQISAFADLDASAEQTLLKATIRAWPEQQAEFKAAGEAWRTGDVEALDAIINAPLRERAEAAYAALVVDLNRQWADRVDALSREPGIAFVAAPAAHLIGPDSVVLMLRERGVVVERIVPTGADDKDARRKARKAADAEKRKAEKDARREEKRRRKMEQRKDDKPDVDSEENPAIDPDR